jgi:hypothetical protein
MYLLSALVALIKRSRFRSSRLVLFWVVFAMVARLYEPSTIHGDNMWTLSQDTSLIEAARHYLRVAASTVNMSEVENHEPAVSTALLAEITVFRHSGRDARSQSPLDMCNDSFNIYARLSLPLRQCIPSLGLMGNENTKLTLFTGNERTLIIEEYSDSDCKTLTSTFNIFLNAGSTRCSDDGIKMELTDMPSAHPTGLLERYT